MARWAARPSSKLGVIERFSSTASWNRRTTLPTARMRPSTPASVGGSAFETRTVIVYYRLGKLSITPALPAGMHVRITGEYLLPVAFEDDWQKYAIDESTTGSYKVSVKEILPVELNII